MKLLSATFDAKDGYAGAATVIPEESDDLWHLYNITDADDELRASTLRKVVVGGGGASEKRHVTLTIRVESVEYDAKGDCLRVAGANISESEWVRLGARHTIEVQLRAKLTLAKPGGWDHVHRDTLSRATDAKRSAELAALLCSKEHGARLYLVTRWVGLFDAIVL
jgi:protein pelota